MKRWSYSPYECPRCGYTSDKKTCMRSHLYSRSVVCPNSYDVELTDSIKEHVLNNRVYKIPKEPDLPDLHFSVLNLYFNYYSYNRTPTHNESHKPHRILITN